MTREAAISEIVYEYNKAYFDYTFINRAEAAFNAADNAALGIVWEKYGIMYPVDNKPEYRKEATELRIAAIGF